MYVYMAFQLVSMLRSMHSVYVCSAGHGTEMLAALLGTEVIRM